MDGARSQFLPRTAFSRNQHRRPAGRNLTDQSEHLLHFGRSAHHLAEHAVVAELTFQAACVRHKDMRPQPIPESITSVLTHGLAA